MWTMFKTALSNTWEFIKKVALGFHHWVQSIAPGLKTYIVTALGAVGSAAGSLQEYFTGIPLEKLVGATEAMIITMVLFTMAFWFRSMKPKE